MTKPILPILLAVPSFAVSAADFLTDFTEANMRLAERRYAEAASSFTRLAKANQGALKDKCLSYAATALAAQGKYDDALALADGISDPAWEAYTRMSVYFANHKTRKKIVAEFKDENLESWPEEIAYKGYRMRGQSAGATAEAIPDLEKAIAGAGRDARRKLCACAALAAAAKAVGDRAKMLLALDRVISVGEEDRSVRGNHVYLTPALAYVSEAIADKDYGAALKALGTMGQHKGSWTCRIQAAYGDLYAAKGDKARAAACYQRALAEKGVRQVFLKPVRQKLANLQARQNRGDTQ